MNFKTFLKTTETIVVFSGLALSLLLGKFWIIATAIAYTVVNIPNAWKSFISWLDKKSEIDVDFESRESYHVGTRPKDPPKTPKEN